MKLSSPIHLLAVACAACGTGARVQAEPPAPAPSINPPATVVISDTVWRTLTVCVADGDGMREVRTQYNITTGDTLIDGRPFAEVYPADSGYASSAEWFIRDEIVVLNGQKYVKYGISRELGPGDLSRAGEYRGVPVFAVRGREDDVSFRYVLVRPECIFQFYEGPHYGAVRGR